MNGFYLSYSLIVSGQLLEAMLQDSGIPLKSIQVDGGMTANSLLMQLQADLMGIDVGKVSFTLSFHDS